MHALKRISDPKRGDPVHLKLFIVSTNPLPGGRFIDSGRFSKLGWISKTSDLTISNLKDVTWRAPSGQTWRIDVFLNQDDEAKLKLLSEANLGKRVLIVVGHELVSAPTIKTSLKYGFLIEGSGQSQLEAVKNELANLISQQN